MYSRHNWKNFQQRIQTRLSRKQQTFSAIFIPFLESIQILCKLKKKISLIAWIFGRLFTPRNVVTWMPESSCFRTPYESQLVHVSQTLPQSAPQHCYPKFPLTTDKISYEIFLSVRSEISRLFGNTLTPDHRYSPHNWKNFPQDVQTPLSQKPTTIFSNIYSIFAIYTKLFEFWRKRSCS